MVLNLRLSYDFNTKPLSLFMTFVWLCLWLWYGILNLFKTFVWLSYDFGMTLVWVWYEFGMSLVWVWYGIRMHIINVVSRSYGVCVRVCVCVKPVYQDLQFIRSMLFDISCCILVYCHSVACGVGMCITC